MPLDKGKWCVENVIPFYKPLLSAIEIQRHLFWANFQIRNRGFLADNIDKGKIKEYQDRVGFNLSKYSVENKKTVLRNCVYPPLGLHILNESKSNVQQTLFK